MMMMSGRMMTTTMRMKRMRTRRIMERVHSKTAKEVALLMFDVNEATSIRLCVQYEKRRAWLLREIKLFL